MLLLFISYMLTIVDTYGIYVVKLMYIHIVGICVALLVHTCIYIPIYVCMLTSYHQLNSASHQRGKLKDYEHQVRKWCIGPAWHQKCQHHTTNTFLKRPHRQSHTHTPTYINSYKRKHTHSCHLPQPQPPASTQYGGLVAFIWLERPRMCFRSYEWAAHTHIYIYMTYKYSMHVYVFVLLCGSVIGRTVCGVLLMLRSNNDSRWNTVNAKKSKSTAKETLYNNKNLAFGKVTMTTTTVPMNSYHAVAFVAKVAAIVIITVVFAFAIVVVVAVVAAKPPPVAFVKSFLTQCSCGLNAHFVVISTNEKLRSCKFEGCCRFNHMSPLFTLCTYNTYIHIVIKSLKFQRAPNISLHFTSRGISAVKSFKRFFDDWNG